MLVRALPERTIRFNKKRVGLSFASVDPPRDCAHAMDSSIEAASADPTAATFSQVVFTDVPRFYPISTSVTCNYTVNPTFQPQSRDWVGIFKVGWSSAKDYHTFVWVEPGLDLAGQETLTKQAVFKEYYLPKDDEFYQFCYIV